MSSITVGQEVFNLFYSFNNTLFKLYFQKRAFINEIVHLDDAGFIRFIYEKGDIKFASALINTGVAFSSNKLLFGLYSRDYNVLKTHITDIRDSISISDYRISHDILDAMYSNHYVRHYDSFECFYPPAILANITKTNRPEYSAKIYQLYKDLYDGGSTVIKDVLDTCAVVALNSNTNISIIAPITDSSAFKHNLYINVSTPNELRPACLIPLYNFDDLEVGRALHELTHLATYHNFQNNGNPYKYSDNSQKQGYNYTSKQMISNITSLMKIDFSLAGVENTTITTLEFKNDLLEKKDIILYSTIHRLDEPIILNLVSKIFFQYAKSSESATKYIKALYEAEVISKNTSKAAEIALERFGDWAIYPDEELDKESVARFVELHYRFEKLGYNQSVLESMMNHWQNNISPIAIELKKSVHFIDCIAEEPDNSLSTEHEISAATSILGRSTDIPDL